MVPRRRFELPTLRVWTVCSSQLSYLGIIWWRELDLNQRPSGYEPDELPDCSIPRQAKHYGASSRTWTGTELLPQDFKSCASTDFATKAKQIYKNNYTIYLFLCQVFFWYFFRVVVTNVWQLYIKNNKVKFFYLIYNLINNFIYLLFFYKT